MLRVIDTETCGLQGGIVEIASGSFLHCNFRSFYCHNARRIFYH